jgi:hypothetical protein
MKKPLGDYSSGDCVRFSRTSLQQIHVKEQMSLSEK